MGFCASLGMIALSYFSLNPGIRYLHHFLLTTSYGGLANVVTIYQVIFSLCTYWTAIMSSVAFLVAALISALFDFIQQRKYPKQSDAN